jgi:hypothetical protein
MEDPLEDDLDGREEFAKDLATWAPLNAYRDVLGLPEDAEVMWAYLSQYEASDYSEIGRVDYTKTRFEIGYLRDGKCERPSMAFTADIEDGEAAKMADTLLTLLVKSAPAPQSALPLIPHGKYRFRREPPRFVRFAHLGWQLFGMAEDLVEGTDVEVRKYSDHEVQVLRVGKAVAERTVEHRQDSRYGEGSTRFVVTDWRPLVIEPEDTP